MTRKKKNGQPGDVTLFNQLLTLPQAGMEERIEGQLTEIFEKQYPGEISMVAVKRLY